MKIGKSKIGFIGILIIGIVSFIPGTVSGQQQLECGADLTIEVDDNSVFFPSSTISNTNYAIEKAFSDSNSVVVTDVRCDNSGFTASVSATHYSSVSSTIEYTNLRFKTTAFSTIEGDSFGVSASREDSYAAFYGSGAESDPIDILIGDTQVRNPSQWALNPTLELTVPAYQAGGTYTNSISFTIL